MYIFFLSIRVPWTSRKRNQARQGFGHGAQGCGIGKRDRHSQLALVVFVQAFRKLGFQAFGCHSQTVRVWGLWHQLREEPESRRQ